MLIFLTGFMGCGKSTTGKKLAGKLSFEFIDLDQYIEQRHESTIAEILNVKGEEYFRNIETACLAELASKSNVVISTGGGTPCFNHNMNLINASGVSIYLKLSVDALFVRLKNAKHQRPLLDNLEGEKLRMAIRTKLAEREPFYALSTYKVKAKDLNLEELSAFLLEKVLQPEA
ncbi:MAG: shikimate kinase [Bacteroidetes bacterium]|nr:shikimate kinase [Bacteroidota bacterium]HET6244258.1 shikimate kinase [Bacteroidia bacterium]